MLVRRLWSDKEYYQIKNIFHIGSFFQLNKENYKSKYDAAKISAVVPGLIAFN
jgi:hypothetical protein